MIFTNIESIMDNKSSRDPRNNQREIQLKFIAHLEAQKAARARADAMIREWEQANPASVH
jgi:hypothetical protein